MHTVKSRTSFQCARAGWRPRRRGRQALASDIAASIQQHCARGSVRYPQEYTQDEETLRLVEAALEAQRAEEGEHYPMTEADHHLF